MSVEPKHIPFDEFIRNARTLFDDMERDGQPVVVERAGKLFTLRPPKTRRRKKTGRITADDPMWALAGAFASGEPNNDVASNKHKYLADAIASHFAPAPQAQPPSADERDSADPS